MLKKFIQGKPANSLIEGFLEKHKQYLEDLDKSSSDKEIARYRNCFTMVKMRELFIRGGFSSVQLKLSEPEYYEMSLNQRAQFLNTSQEYLCKTMIMENTSYNPEFEG